MMEYTPLDLARDGANAFGEAMMRTAFGRDVRDLPELAPTPRDTVFRDGGASLYRFRQPAGAPEKTALPLLVVPSMINRWYVLDLRKGSSFCEALVGGGVDTFLLDWGVPRDEDRHLTWEEVIDRLARMVRRVQRITGAPKVGILGYCMGATLSAVYSALHPGSVAALANLAGPIDFHKGGILAHLVRPEWFDADAVADAGNVSPKQMQSGFQAMRPTLDLSKMINLLDRAKGGKPVLDGFYAMETWGSDNIPFPAAAYRTYITELYQKNLLVKGEHRVRGRRVDLKAITAPILIIGADRDTICPLPAAKALIEDTDSQDTQVLQIPGGHVGAVVGSRASKELYPATTAWFRQRLVG
ncbi:MAG: alpha/beta fold hydrolase [Polyangiales bacterium]